MDFIFSTMGGSSSKLVLRATFQGNWRKAIHSLYNQKIHPDEASATLAVMCIRGIFRKVPQHNRDAALHALRVDSRNDVTANHLRAIHAGISLYGSDALAESGMYEIIGVLEGLDGDDLDEYRQARLLSKVFDKAGYQEAAKDAEDYWRSIR